MMQKWFVYSYDHRTVDVAEFSQGVNIPYPILFNFNSLKTYK